MSGRGRFMQRRPNRLGQIDETVLFERVQTRSLRSISSQTVISNADYDEMTQERDHFKQMYESLQNQIRNLISVQVCL